MTTTLPNGLISCNSEDLNKALSDLPDGKYSVLGTVTATTIDFSFYEYIKADVLEIDGKEDLYYVDYLNPNERWFTVAIDSFRSILSAAGITEYEKLVIIKQI